MAVDARLLKQFLALSESLHFHRASEICHVSASTLSRSIKQLEDQLGVTLFARDNRHVSLTAEGQKFQEYARENLRQWEIIQNELMAESKELRGSLNMYCSVTASYSFLHHLLRQFRQSYPNISIKLRTGDPELAIQQIVSGQEDLAIAAQPDKVPTGVAFKQVASSPLLFIAPTDDHLLAISNLSLSTGQDWLNIPFIIQEQGVVRQRLDEWFQRLGERPEICAQAAGNEAIVSMVSLGFGIGVVPEIVINNSPLKDQVRILKTTTPLPPYNVGFCSLEKRLKNPLVNAFWSLLKKRAQLF